VLGVTIRPAFEERAKAVTVRSISPTSRTPTALNSTPNDGATAWIALKWAGPMVRSRSAATRVSLGGLEVDHQLVLGRRLHRKVSRFLAPEDAIDVSGRAATV
jgi:hypothetical protein